MTSPLLHDRDQSMYMGTNTDHVASITLGIIAGIFSLLFLVWLSTWLCPRLIPWNHLTNANRRPSIFSRQELGATQGFSLNRTSPVPPSASSNDFPMHKWDAGSTPPAPRYDHQPFPAKPRTMSRAYSRTRHGSVISTNSPPSTSSFLHSTSDDGGQNYSITRPVRALLARLDPRSWRRPSLPFTRRDSSPDRLTSLHPYDFTPKSEVAPVPSPRAGTDPYLSSWNLDADLDLTTQPHQPDPSRKYGLGITMPTAFWANANGNTNNGAIRSITKPTNLDAIMNAGDLGISAPKLSPGTLQRIERKYTSIRPAGPTDTAAPKIVAPAADASTAYALSQLPAPQDTTRTTGAPEPEKGSATSMPLTTQRQDTAKVNGKGKGKAVAFNTVPQVHDAPSSPSSTNGTHQDTNTTNQNPSASSTTNLNTSTNTHLTTTAPTPKPTLRTNLPLPFPTTISTPTPHPNAAHSPLHSAFSPLQPRIYIPGAGKNSTDRRPTIDEGVRGNDVVGGGGGWISVELGSPRVAVPVLEDVDEDEDVSADRVDIAHGGIGATAGTAARASARYVFQAVDSERQNRFRRFTRAGEITMPMHGGSGLERAGNKGEGTESESGGMESGAGLGGGRRKRESEMSVFMRHPGDSIG